MINEDYTKVNLDQWTPDPEASREVTPGPTPPTETPGQENRDPRGMNQHLKVDFEGVIAEPSSTHSFDKVWSWSNISFEVCRLWGYRVISLLCAIPVSIITGFLFASVTCLHIWCVMPCVRICLLSRPTCQSVCHSLMDIVVTPLCSSVGRCFQRVHLHVARY